MCWLALATLCRSVLCALALAPAASWLPQAAAAMAAMGRWD
jgi:hypothetical protein